VPRYLQDDLNVPPQQRDAWYRHWIAEDMTSVERLLAYADAETAARGIAGPWCFGAKPTLADVCLAPQFAKAQRMGCDMSAYTRSLRLYERSNEHPAFERAKPQNPRRSVKFLRVWSLQIPPPDDRRLSH